KALQRSRRLSFVVQGEFEKLVQRVIGFMAEPPQDARPAAVGTEQPRIECKWRLGLETALAFFQTIERVAEFAFAHRVKAQSGTQRSLPLPRQREQVVIAKPEQRTLQRNRQRQIVLRQQ